MLKYGRMLGGIMNKKSNLIIGIFIGASIMMIITVFMINKFNIVNKSYSEVKNREQSNNEQVKIIEETQLIEEATPEKEETKKGEVKSVPNTKTSSVQKKEDVIEYFEKQKKYTKDLFIKIVDFIFYKKEINGYTFDKLTQEMKLKVITIAIKIDYKVEEIYPNYKEKLDEKYNDFLEKANDRYLEITNNICLNVGDDVCIQAKQDYTNMKETFKNSFDKLKQISDKGIESLKDWYENYSSKN